MLLQTILDSRKYCWGCANHLSAQFEVRWLYESSESSLTEYGAPGIIICADDCSLSTFGQVSRHTHTFDDPVCVFVKRARIRVYAVLTNSATAEYLGRRRRL